MRRSVARCLVGEGGTCDGDGVGHVGLVGGDGVDVALDDDGVAGGDNGGSGEVEPTQQRAFAVKLGLWAVDVLRSVVFDESASEAYRSGVFVVDGEDES